MAHELVDREALLRALELNPALYKQMYTELLVGPIDKQKIKNALKVFETWVTKHTNELFAPILDYLKSAGGEPQSVTQITHHFRRNYNFEHVILACEWLADLGVVEKASTPVKLTVQSQMEVEELAFFMN